MAIFNALSSFGGWGLLALRVAFGIIFLAHGLSKLKNIRGTTGWFESIGIKPGMFWAPVVAFVETFGALAVMAGFGAQIAGALLTISMTVALLWRLRSGHKLVSGYEIDLILLAAAIFLATNGGGAYSLDNYLSL